MQRDMGLMDRDLYDLTPLYDTSFELDKAARLEYGETRMTHAMLFTGVDVVDGAARRWRGENSWGGAAGQQGFLPMNDPWGDEATLQLAARREYLADDLQAALSLDPVVLAPSDPA